MASDAFEQAAEGKQNWAIRGGSEPFDFHGFVGKGTLWDKFVENLGMQSGIGGFASTSYIEIGTVDDEDNFHVAKRIQGMGLNEDWEMEGLTQRFVSFVTDGKYTPFRAHADGENPYEQEGPYEGDLIYRDDPHESLPNQLQHADGPDRTGLLFQGTEREVLQIYAAMVRTSIEMNNRDLTFGLLGQSGEEPNSNTLYAELKEDMREMGAAMGIPERIQDFSGPQERWHKLLISPLLLALDSNIGEDAGRITTDAAKPVTVATLADLRGYVDALERTAADQLNTLRPDTSQDLETPLPRPPIGGSAP